MSVFTFISHLLAEVILVFKILKQKFCLFAKHFIYLIKHKNN